MRETDLSQLSEIVLSSKQGAHFIPLGDEPDKMKRDISVLRKIKSRQLKSSSKIWGTLGMADDTKPLIMKGKLIYSKKGNPESALTESGKNTMNEIELFQIGQENDDKLKGITERFISFEKVDFPNYPKTISSIEKIPVLRLTLFLEPDEGALVFYDISKRHELGEIEYIQPKATKNHSCDGRDRLTFHIPIFPPRPMTPAGKNLNSFKVSESGKKRSHMIIKIITGKRKHSETTTILKRLHYKLFGKTYQLLKWDSTAGIFEPIDKSVLDTSKNDPIFMMIHGTFSSTSGTFKHLVQGGKNSWVGKLDNTGKYKHILAFDHPTIFKGPQDNVMALAERLPHGFSAPVNILTHSRGGLVGKYIAAHLPNLSVQRGVLVACANGVGYFSLGWGVAKFLSIAKKIFTLTKPELAYVAGFAQHSVEWFLNQPGPQAMTKGSDSYKEILGIDPVTHCDSKFYMLHGDWEKSLVEKERFWIRAGSRGLDFVLKFILGRENDWVVGTKEQNIVTPGRRAGIATPQLNLPVAAKHSTYFSTPAVQKALTRYLS